MDSPTRPRQVHAGIQRCHPRCKLKQRSFGPDQVNASILFALRSRRRGRGILTVPARYRHLNPIYSAFVCARALRHRFRGWRLRPTKPPLEEEKLPPLLLDEDEAFGERGAPLDSSALACIANASISANVRGPTRARLE